MLPEELARLVSMQGRLTEAAALPPIPRCHMSFLMAKNAVVVPIAAVLCVSLIRIIQPLSSILEIYIKLCKRPSKAQKSILLPM